MRTVSIVLLALAACGEVTSNTDKGNLPTIDKVAPDHGSPVGGTTVTLTGSHLQGGDPIVLVGGKLATNVNVASDTMLTFDAPAADQEGAIVDVTVANDNGFQTSPAAFTYNHRPVVLAIDPPIGKAAGGTQVTITGRGFDAGTASVTIAGGTATNVMVVDDKTIKATTGAASADTKAFTATDLVVTNDNGSGTLTGGFEVSNKGLIVIERNNPTELFYVDPVLGSSVRLSTAALHLSSCALDPNTNTLFATGRDNTGQHALMTFDPISGTVTSLGPLTAPGGTNAAVGSLTFVGNTLFGVTAPSGQGSPRQLCTVDRTNGNVTLIGTVQAGITQGSSIALKDTSQLFYARNTSGALQLVSTADSTISSSGSVPITGGNNGPQVLGLVNVAGTLFVGEQTSPGAIIYRINLATGAMTRVAQVFMNNGQVLAGMCETPSTF